MKNYTRTTLLSH